MAISQIAALTAHISFLLSELIFGTPGVGRSSPHQMAIVDSYSENSYLSDQVLADLPPIKWQFHRLLLWQLIFHSYSQNSYLADQVLADVPPIKWQFHRLLLWQLILHYYSQNSYLAHQVLADLVPHQMVIIDSYSDSSYLADQVLADLPPVECWFYRFQLWQLIFHSYFQNSYLAHQVLPDLVPMSNGDYRFLLWELIFGRPSVGRYTPLLNADFTDSCFDSSYFIPTLRTHIWQTRCWQIYPHISNGNCRFLLWELIFGRPNVGRSTSHQMAISQIAALTAHISFLLWELIFVWPSVGRSSHPKWQFHRLLLWQLIFHSYSESSYLADQVLADLTPLLNSWFHRFLASDSSYFIPTLRAHICLTKCWQI